MEWMYAQTKNKNMYKQKGICRMNEKYQTEAVVSLLQ